jgi:hypothetical protein
MDSKLTYAVGWNKREHGYFQASSSVGGQSTRTQHLALLRMFLPTALKNSW